MNNTVGVGRYVGNASPQGHAASALTALVISDDLGAYPDPEPQDMPRRFAPCSSPALCTVSTFLALADVSVYSSVVYIDPELT